MEKETALEQPASLGPATSKSAPCGPYGPAATAPPPAAFPLPWKRGLASTGWPDRSVAREKLPGQSLAQSK